jgi:hypothetical protein
MKKVFKFIEKIHAPTKFAVSAMLLTAMIQVPVLHSKSEANNLTRVTGILTHPIQTREVNAAEIEVGTTQSLSGIFFGGDASQKSTNEMIDNKVEFVSTRDAYPASLSVIQKHEKTIRREDN